MKTARHPNVVAPLCALTATGFLVATAYWLIVGNALFILINAFWFLVLAPITLVAWRSPGLEERLAQSLAARLCERLRPAFLYLGPLVGLGYALAAAFWWSRQAYFWTVVNAAWALFFAAAGILVALRGFRCALTIVLLSAGGLYLVTATWWFAEGRELSPQRDVRFFCFNLFWCAVLIAAGLIIDRSRRVVETSGDPVETEPIRGPDR